MADPRNLARCWEWSGQEPTLRVEATDAHDGETISFRCCVEEVCSEPAELLLYVPEPAPLPSLLVGVLLLALIPRRKPGLAAVVGPEGGAGGRGTDPKS